MGSLADFLKQRERYATHRSDSQPGTTTPHGRPRSTVDALGYEKGRDVPESRDSQGVCRSSYMGLPEVSSGGPSHSHRFAAHCDESQANMEARSHAPGPSCHVPAHADHAPSAESRDSQRCEGVRVTLKVIARAEGIPQAVVDAIDPRDLTTCAGLPAPTLGAYLRVLHRSRQMAAGEVPTGWTHLAQCIGCGPVWLPPAMPAAVRACPWCRHRRHGRWVPVASA